MINLERVVRLSPLRPQDRDRAAEIAAVLRWHENHGTAPGERALDKPGGYNDGEANRERVASSRQIDVPQPKDAFGH